MTSMNRPVDYVVDRPAQTAVVNYHDQVRWGPILAGLVTALSTQLVLSALGVAIGMSSIGGSGAPRSEAGGVGAGIGIWSIISLLISLFVGGWIATRSAGRMTRNSALLNGAILWASTLALSAWLLSSGVSGAFGLVAANADTLINQIPQSPAVVPSPSVTAQQAPDLAGNAAKVSGSFVLGSLLGLAAALIGSAAGCRIPRSTVNDNYATPMGGRE
jgi:hypothetical protein